MAQTISIPSVIVNNEVVKIKPNSFTYTEGFGETMVRTESAGGGSVSTVTARDISTAQSVFSFTLESRAENINRVRGWKVNLSNNAVIVADNNSGFTRTFTNATITNDPEIGLTADGEISVEWKSDPAS